MSKEPPEGIMTIEETKLTFKILGVDERLVQLEEGLVRAGVHPGHGLPIIDAETLGHVGLVIRNCNKQNGKI